MPQKKLKKEIELPSFLLKLENGSKDVTFLPKATNNNQYLGPLFFGQCHQFHPPLHSLNYSSFRHVQKAHQNKANIQNLFLEKTEGIKKQFPTRQVFKSVPKRKNLISDPYIRRARGVRRAFVPEVRPPKIDLGETTSVIEGETTLEIPLYRLKKDLSSDTETEFELVMLSDLKEKKRSLMPYKERISHIHFPKQFATVAVIGPTIPAAITIKKLPSKRKTELDMNLLIKSEDDLSPKKEGKKKEKIIFAGETEFQVISTDEEQSIISTDSNEIIGEDDTEREGQRFNSELSLTGAEEETSVEENGEMDTAEEVPLKEESRETNIAEESDLQEEKEEGRETDTAEELHLQEKDEEDKNNDVIEEKGDENPNEEDAED